MSLEELNDIERVKANFNEVVKAYNIIEKQLWVIKDWVKVEEADKQYWDVKLKYSKYLKLKPRNIQDVISRYPIVEYPNLYNITLSKEAQHIITDEELFDTVEIASVRIELPD